MIAAEERARLGISRVAKLLNVRVSTTTVSPAFDESALVVRAKAGDTNAFSELVQQYDRRVFRMAKQITQNDDDAEDVLQETFLKAYTHLDDFQGNSKFYTWLVRIAVNEALMKLRKRRSDRTCRWTNLLIPAKMRLSAKSRFGTKIRRTSTRAKSWPPFWIRPSKV